LDGRILQLLSEEPIGEDRGARRVDRDRGGRPGRARVRPRRASGSRRRGRRSGGRSGRGSRLGLVRAASEPSLKSRPHRPRLPKSAPWLRRSEEHTSELQSHHDLVCRLLLEKKKKTNKIKKKKKKKNITKYTKI